MAEKSKHRMNLVAIKKVDPYARDIVDSSSHVAFYTFNSDENQWDKTDVEGAFFIYSRNAVPYHSIFIINRLNTTSFIEPITHQLELQSQPPFLLYRNERSRIRGFWFYNSDECDRISTLVSSLVEKCKDETVTESQLNIQNMTNTKQNNVNLFKMLSDAQKEFDLQTSHSSITAKAPSNNVLEFFASAKPTTVENKPLLANTLSVEQIEMQQRSKKNDDDEKNQFQHSNRKQTSNYYNMKTAKSDSLDLTNELAKFLNTIDLKANKQDSYTAISNAQPHQNLLCTDTQNILGEVTDKPALMPPTMFEKSSERSLENDSPPSEQASINQAQFFQESSKLRMNLVAIKKVDPYARDIVDSSSHVAFYTFNSDRNEWDKTDVEGAFFIYSRNAAPCHSIFIINRLNTTSFVEPITTKLELQSQPPFLLYRNERSRIRGFWFYNSDECDRISTLVSSLVDKSEPLASSKNLSNKGQENVNLLQMLIDAQKEFNFQTNQSNVVASSNVLEFFASAKSAADRKRLLASTFSVEQIEKQQRTNELAKFLKAVDLKRNNHPPISATSTCDVSQTFQNFLCAEVNVQTISSVQGSSKPALMTPTMFEKSIGGNLIK